MGLSGLETAVALIQNTRTCPFVFKILLLAVGSQLVPGGGGGGYCGLPYSRVQEAEKWATNGMFINEKN